jgi:hypothetical protein
MDRLLSIHTFNHNRGRTIPRLVPPVLANNVPSADLRVVNNLNKEKYDKETTIFSVKQCINVLQKCMANVLCDT